MSESIWHDICPVCQGRGKVDEISDFYKEAKFKNERAGLSKTCPGCNGKGTVLVVKKLRKGI